MSGTRDPHTGGWLAPPSGGYSGRGPHGEIVPPPSGPPPAIPATEAGIRARDAAADAQALIDSIDPTTMRDGRRLRAIATAHAALNQAVRASIDAGDPWALIAVALDVTESEARAAYDTTPPMTPDQRRSLLLAHAVAGKVAQNPDLLDIARENLNLLQARHTRGRTAAAMTRWRELVDGSLEALLAVLTSPSMTSRDLRQNSPFAGVLTEAERQRVLRTAEDPRTERGAKVE
jgi:hypothetical protein